MADPLPLPERALLRTVMPDDFRYGHVYGYTADQMRAYAAAARRAALLEAAELIADDATAISYQTMGQYRTALIREMRERANG